MGESSWIRGHFERFRGIQLILLATHYTTTTTHVLPSSTIFSTYNNSCSSAILCDPAALLACISGICQCESPSNQIYIPGENICKSTVGGQCSLTLGNGGPGGQERPCIDHATCVTILEEGPAVRAGQNHTECRCRENFIENASGACVPGIGEPCSYRPDECNPLGQIVCKNNVCACMDNLQVYDPEFSRCVSPAGTHCKLDSLQLGCVKNAMCYPFYYWIPPRCLCKPGFLQSPTRTCLPDHSYSHS